MASDLPEKMSVTMVLAAIRRLQQRDCPGFSPDSLLITTHSSCLRRQKVAANQLRVQRYGFSVINDYSHLITICSKFPKITGYGSVSASSAYWLSAMRFSRTFFRLSAEPIPNFFLMLARWVVMFDSDLLSSAQISLNFLFCRIR